MIFLKSICLLALSWISMTHTMDPGNEIEFRGTIAGFKKHFGECDFTKNVDSVPNFEDYVFELAFEKGNLAVARWFLQHGCNLQKLYKKGRLDYRETSKPPLIAAVENGHLPAVKLLLIMGANPNGLDCPNTMECGHARGPGTPFICKNSFALHLALYKGHNAIAKTLIKAGAKRYYWAEATSAVDGGNSEVIETLEMKIDCWYQVDSAVCQRNPRLVGVVLKNLTERKKKYLPDVWYEGFNYATLVIKSIFNDTPEITRMLLDAQPSFDVNSVSPWRSSIETYTRPLIVAIQKGNLPLALDLIKRGAWINPPGGSYSKYDNIEFNPLYAAAKEDNIRAVEFFLQQGANPNHLALYGDEPLRIISCIKKIKSWSSREQPNLDRIIQMCEEHSQAGTP